MSFVTRIALAGSLCLSSAVVPLMGQETPSVQAQAPVDSLPITAGDTVSVHVFEIPDMDQLHLRVTDSGEIPLILLGAVKVAGLTPAAASQVIANAYMAKNYLRDAHVSVSIDDYTSSSSVTVYGFVNGGGTLPGVSPLISGGLAGSNMTGTTLPLDTPRPLLSVLAMAGGLNDRASHTITIKRRDPNIKPFSVRIPNDPDIALANDPLIYPGDIVVVPRAGIVYILGDVTQAHGVVMQEDGKITLMQALSQAGSPETNAKLSKLMIFRKTNGQYQSLKINLGDMVKGKIPDVDLMAEDVVWVPLSLGKNLLINGASILSAVGSATATGIIYSH